MIKTALHGLDCRIAHAANWAEGMAATLRCGIATQKKDSEGVCVFLGDMPLVPMHLCPAISAAAASAGYAARPRHDGKPGHPVAFTRHAFSDLMMLTGDQGATPLLRAHADKVTYYDTADCGVVFDVDTPTDLETAVRLWKDRAISATSDSATSCGAFPKPGSPMGA